MTDHQNIPSVHQPQNAPLFLKWFLGQAEHQTVPDLQEMPAHLTHLRVHLKDHTGLYRFTGRSITPKAENDVYVLAQVLREQQKGAFGSGEVLLTLMSQHSQTPQPFATLERKWLQGTALENLTVRAGTTELHLHQSTPNWNGFYAHTPESIEEHRAKWLDVDRALVSLLKSSREIPPGPHLKVRDPAGHDLQISLVFPNTPETHDVLQACGLFRMKPQSLFRPRTTRNKIESQDWAWFFNEWFRHTTLMDMEGDVDLIPRVPDSGLGGKGAQDKDGDFNVFIKDLTCLRTSWAALEGLHPALLHDIGAKGQFSHRKLTRTQDLPERQLLKALENATFFEGDPETETELPYIEFFLPDVYPHVFRSTRRYWVNCILDVKARETLNALSCKTGDVLVVYHRFSRKNPLGWLLPAHLVRLFFACHPTLQHLPALESDERVIVAQFKGKQLQMAFHKLTHLQRKRSNVTQQESQVWRQTRQVEPNDLCLKFLVFVKEQDTFKNTFTALQIPMLSLPGNLSQQAVLDWLLTHSTLHHADGDVLLEAHHPTFFVADPNDPTRKASMQVKREELQKHLPFALIT